MIERAGVQPEPLRLVATFSVDGPLEEELAKALADELGHQAELHQLDLAFLPPIQLREAGRHALDMQDVNLVLGIVNYRRELLVGQLPATEPLPRPAHVRR